MSVEYDNSGILSKNDRKEKPTHPDHSGSCTINGVEYWLSAWIKERKDGSGRFFSLAFKPKDESQTPVAAGATSTVAPDDDIPF